ncbi:lipoate--protein ligase [Sinanaerobacter chloroacetimidivorans]|jgi:lipoate-protein ligase A|uniref:lipoate--protein ligase n=1 Tax=Sinanaerobacter chloroacetimidivorans TaxID=2818044 RepID=A0A8J7W4J5_9FIRM|nr:lipoate--protein ligase [Sinanaerobacter chloroacetimidivorans]MBR0599233.1 lipoate--protein ligase [Sinanaerobacter chloroacetimidivorans]
MKCMISPFDSCYRNIGSEEYFLSHFDDDIFYLYINSPCIVVGKHQNTYSEINQDYVRENGIDVVRRMSGGGAVYHDHGNLNYGFITKNKGKDINDVFQEFTRPILKVLNQLGVEACFSGRNDLTLDGKKFSGNAQYHTKDKVLIHGTLLFSSDLEKVSKSLNADPRKFQDKSVKSVKSRVTNILPYLPSPITIEEFSATIIQEVLSLFPGASLYELTEQDKEAIGSLADTKYAAWEWVYGSSPKFTYQHTLKYDLGLLDIGLNVESGIIKEISIYGDFFGTKDADDLLMLIRGLPYDKEVVRQALAKVHLEDYIFGLSGEMFIDCLFTNTLEETL